MRIFLLFLLILPGVAVSESPPFEEVTVVHSKKIDENSGIDLSYKYPNTVWTHNDSGGTPYLYLVSLATGRTLATVHLKGSENRDWEDIVTFQKDGKSYVAVGDTGDNLRRRADYQICIIEEPDFDLEDEDSIELAVEQSDWINLRYQYEDGAKNCESIAVDLENHQFVLVEKIYQNVKGIPGVYRLDIPTQSVEDATARRIGDLKIKNTSAMDISDQGNTMLIRAYHAGFVYRRKVGETWEEVFKQPGPEPFIFPMQRQGEGVCFTPDGKSVLISSEKKRQPIYRVTLPGL